MKRRFFLYSTLIATLAACTGRRKVTEREADHPVTDLPHLRNTVADMTEEEIMALLKLRAKHHMSTTGNCAQATYLALNDVFDMGDEVDIRAFTALPGIAERGGTCGAITSSLMVIGMVYGSNRPGDRAAFDSTVNRANKFIDRFSNEVGHTQCRHILKDALGEELDLRKPVDLHQYRAMDGPGHCAGVVAKAATITAEVILPAIRKQ